MNQKKADREKIFYAIRRHVERKYPFLTNNEVRGMVGGIMRKRGKKEAAKK